MAVPRPATVNDQGEEIEKLLAIAPRYGIEISLPGH